LLDSLLQERIVLEIFEQWLKSQKQKLLQTKNFK